MSARFDSSRVRFQWKGIPMEPASIDRMKLYTAERERAFEQMLVSMNPNVRVPIRDVDPEILADIPCAVRSCGTCRACRAYKGER